MLRLRILFFFATFFCLSAFLAAQSLPVGSSTYSLTFSGKPCGTISSSITPMANGYSLMATAKLQISNTPFSFSRDGVIDHQLNPVRESLNGVVNGSAVLFGLNSAGGKYAINISANGKQYSNSLAQHPHTVFLPDFDPAAIQVLVTEIATNQNVWALVPKQSGMIYNLQVTNKSQAQGTLNGKPITVQHFSVTIGGVTNDIFASSTGLFLQEETPQQGFALIRTGFKLTPPAKATAPATTGPAAGTGTRAVPATM